VVTRQDLEADIKQHGFCVFDGRVLSNLGTLPTDSEIRAAAPAATPMRGLYNPAGMERWQDALTDVSHGLGAAAIVPWGDSYLAFNGSSGRNGTATAVQRNLMQDRHNPRLREDGSNYGGAGRLKPFWGETTWETADPKEAGGARTDLGCSQDGDAPSYLDSTLEAVRWDTGHSNRRLWYYFDGSAANPNSILNRDRIERVIPLFRQFLNDGTVRCDVKEDGLAAVAIAGAAGTIVCNDTTTIQAKHWPIPAGFTGLTPTNANTIQFGSPAGGTGANDHFAIIAINGDQFNGVMMLAQCNPGARLDLFFNSGTDVLSSYGLAALDNCSSGTRGAGDGGDVSAALGEWNWILNDINADNSDTINTVNVNTWETKLRVAAAHWKARPSQPALLYVIPPAGNTAKRRLLYPSYIRAIHRVLADNTDFMTVWNVGEYLGEGKYGEQAGSSYDTVMSSAQKKISNEDDTHLSARGQIWMGRKLFQITSMGL
jgi:hypothetical protein